MSAPHHTAARLAAQAVNALMAEAALTPKPALVDQRGSGAHRDMDLDCLNRSAMALEPTFFKMAMAAAGRRPNQALREELARIGRLGETDMFKASGGVNTHRGAIWVLGLLVAALAIDGPDADASAIAATAGCIARHADRFGARGDTPGARACVRYAIGGARKEAARGFPHIALRGLPALRAARLRGVDERHAALGALLAIMSSLDDTCLLNRGGRPALRVAQSGARRVLRAGGTFTPRGFSALLALDQELLTRNASPGGCADLLAGCLLIDTASPARG